jgi:hypothetical protein
MRLCKHIVNTPKVKNKMLHNPYLLEKAVFLGLQIFVVSLWHRGKKLFFSTLNVMISQTVWNECTRFGGHVDMEVQFAF